MTTCKDHNDNTTTSYTGWHLWAAKKGKTHRQVKCDECGLFKIWILKGQK